MDNLIVYVAAVIPDTDGKFLCIYDRRRNCWMMPGGQIENQDDSIYSALARELWEELGLGGLTIEDSRPLATVLHKHQGRPCLGTFILFKPLTFDMKPEIKEPKKHLECAYLSMKELERLDVSPEAYVAHVYSEWYKSYTTSSTIKSTAGLPHKK